MCSPGTSARRATFDAIALALAFLAVDAVIVGAALSDLVEPRQALVLILALVAVVVLHSRGDVARALVAGKEKLGLTADDEPAPAALTPLAAEDGWTVERGRGSGTVVHGPSGSYVVETLNRAVRPEDLRRIQERGAGLMPVLCLAQRDDRPHRRDGVWIVGAEHLADWLRARTPPCGRPSER